MRSAHEARRSEGEAEALSRSQGGFSTKLHVRAEGQGRPLVFELTAGQRHETQAFEALTTTAHGAGPTDSERRGYLPLSCGSK